MNLVTFAAAALVLFLDRLTKAVAYNTMEPHQTLKVLPGMFHLTLVLNRGIAFGLFKNMQLLFIIVTLAAVIFLLVYMYMRGPEAGDLRTRLSMGLILGGALGNLFDRLRFGYVIDFLDFRVWPVFNVADLSITIGTAILILRVLFKRGRFTLS